MWGKKNYNIPVKETKQKRTPQMLMVVLLEADDVSRNKHMNTCKYADTQADR